MIRKKQTEIGNNSRGHIMKRAIPLVLVLVLFLSTTVVQEAGAGLFNKGSQKSQESKVAPRYDLFPQVSFHKGVLNRGIGLAWQLDDLDLQVRSDCVITSDFGGEPSLAAGREALVMGAKLNDTIIAYRVRIMKPDYMNESLLESSEVIPSDVDPTVGIGRGPE